MRRGILQTGSLTPTIAYTTHVADVYTFAGMSSDPVAKAQMQCCFQSGQWQQHWLESPTLDSSRVRALSLGDTVR